MASIAMGRAWDHAAGEAGNACVVGARIVPESGGRARVDLSPEFFVVDRNAALADQLLALPSRDRARLAELLLASLEDSDVDADSAWDSEIAQRARDLNNGSVDSISGDAVYAEVERRLRK